MSASYSFPLSRACTLISHRETRSIPPCALELALDILHPVKTRTVCLLMSGHRQQPLRSQSCLFGSLSLEEVSFLAVRIASFFSRDADPPVVGYVSITNGNWDGAEVVEKSGGSIILVNFNYRVGLWGFLASSRLSEDGSLNVGLLDQRMLLKWVKTHILQVCLAPHYCRRLSSHSHQT